MVILGEVHLNPGPSQCTAVVLYVLLWSWDSLPMSVGPVVPCHCWINPLYKYRTLFESPSERTPGIGSLGNGLTSQAVRRFCVQMVGIAIWMWHNSHKTGHNLHYIYSHHWWNLHVLPSQMWSRAQSDTSLYLYSSLGHGSVWLSHICDRVWVWCSGLRTNTETFLCQAVSSTRGDCTLRHEYSIGPTAASLHLASYTLQSASHCGWLIHIHAKYAVAIMVTFLSNDTFSKYKLILQGDPWKCGSVCSQQECVHSKNWPCNFLSSQSLHYGQLPQVSCTCFIYTHSLFTFSESPLVWIRIMLVAP